MEAFSDGVFSIVITLLILNVHMPSGDAVSAATLGAVLPYVGSFVLSFVVVGVYWISHHHMLHFVRQVDRRLLWLNLLLLLCVVFIPFPTSLLSTGFRSPLVISLYGSSLVLTNAAGLFFWQYATTHPDLVAPHLSRQFAKLVMKIHASPICIYVLAIILAEWSIWLSLFLFAAVPAFFIIPNPWLERRTREVAVKPKD